MHCDHLAEAERPDCFPCTEAESVGCFPCAVVIWLRSRELIAFPALCQHLIEAEIADFFFHFRYFITFILHIPVIGVTYTYRMHTKYWDR